MDLSNRTVLIVGGTSGIGRELARRFAAAGSTVAVGGRSPEALMELAGEGFGTISIDVTDGASVASARDAVLARYPELDTVVTMPGVMLLEDLRDPAHFEAAETTIDTNLMGTIRVIDAFTPHLVRRGAGTFITVTSGIAFLPFPPMPTYAASKAAVHAYSEALRAQLDGTGVGVVELVPAVATAGREKVNPHALPLDDFATEVMHLLSQEPTPRDPREGRPRAPLGRARRHLRPPRRTALPGPGHALQRGRPQARSSFQTLTVRPPWTDRWMSRVGAHLPGPGRQLGVSRRAPGRPWSRCRGKAAPDPGRTSRPGWAGFRWPVFDRAVPLAEVPDGYRAMDDRSALKVRITCRARGSAARMVPPFHAAPS
ncbi:hypothetical protein SALBM311S_04472 [Streptomyces alboniger]